ncbi:hypothetical protein [Nocardiopsis synnemataformans]|uniref:hypothetical protein n=1 Tax=Nocardiopsis synnemataformans TaxID=61305 RepID=UPI003EB732F7
MTIVRAAQICYGCPSQWDVWNTSGDYMYLRFRHGHGTVQDEDRNLITSFNTDDDPDLDGIISLPEFARRAGLTLSPNLEY